MSRNRDGQLDVMQAIHCDVVNQMWSVLRLESDQWVTTSSGKLRIDNIKNKCCTLGSVHKPVFAHGRYMYLGFETNTLNVRTTKIYI